MQLSKEEYARKTTHNGCLVQIESPVTQDNGLASLDKPRDNEQLYVRRPYIHFQNIQMKYTCLSSN